MQSKMKMSQAVCAALVGLAMLVAGPAFSQVPSFYTGTLAIGFGDFENTPANGGTDVANNGVPACANANPFVTATFATINIAGFADQAGAGGPAAAVSFGGYAPPDFVAETGGGQAPITSGTCIVQFPPWLASNRLRSRVQFGSQVWPGNQLNVAQTAATGAPGGTVSTGNGIGAAGVPIVITPVNFYSSMASGMQTLVPGSNMFGGGVPVNGNGAVQLGVNFPPFTNGGNPLSTFGVRTYAEGFLPTGPAVYGTLANSAGLPVGVQAGNPYTWQVHTPGPTGTAGFPFGIPPFANAIPLTANLGWQQGANATLGGANFSTMGEFNGIFQKWTTGMVRHSDMSGAFTTDRTATGFDIPITAGNPNGTTRRLQLVTPWSAAIQKDGTGPFGGLLAGLPDFGFGGLAVLDLNITPVPEPGTLSMLGFGAAGLLGFRAMRRRNR